MQEVKSLNSRVLEFLTKPESVTGLVRHLVAPAPPDADQQQQLRQPFAACEVRHFEISYVTLYMSVSWRACTLAPCMHIICGLCSSLM